MATIAPETLLPVPLSERTRTLLFDLAAGDLQRPLSVLDIDWQEAFEGVCHHGLLGLTQRYLKYGESRELLSPQFNSWVENAYRQRAVGMIFMQGKAYQVLSLLADKVEFMVLKGPAIGYAVYPDPILRVFTDLDLVVRERDWPTVHHILLEAGFESEDNLPEPPPKLVQSWVLHEQTYNHQRLGLTVEVHYEDILNAGLRSRDIDGFWERAMTVTTPGIAFKTLSFGDSLIYLSAHVHAHGYFRLTWLSDLAFLLRDHGHQISWPQVLETIHKEEAQVPVYYTLWFLERFLGVSAPDGVADAIKPDRFRLWVHEQYFPSHTVLSDHPKWPPIFSFYHTPFFARLLPDLLVMGRRKDKLHYLFRLLTPPRDWLIYYYALKDTPFVWIHYLLNPMKLSFHILEEIWERGQKRIRRVAQRISLRRSVSTQ